MRRLSDLPLLTALVLIGPAAASASIVAPARDSIATISFTDPSFADARLRIDATRTVGAGSTGTKRVGLETPPSLQSYSLSSIGAVQMVPDGFTPPGTFDLTVAASAAGRWSIAERFPISDDPLGPGPFYHHVNGNDAFVPFVNGTLPALELTLFVGGLVDTGGSFGVGFVIPGNFSTTGGLASTSGQYFLANLDEQWTVDTAFVFDPVANLTRFHATNPSYGGLDSAHPSPFLDVCFFAASVPEPGAWTMVIAGLGAIGAVTRRRSRRSMQPGQQPADHCARDGVGIR